MKLDLHNLYFLCIFSFLLFLATPGQTKDVIQFPITHPMTMKEAEQLNYTVQLIGFLNIQYQDQIKNKGGNFTWSFDWSNPYLGAGSTFFDNTYSVVLWGGMIRAPGSDFEVLAVMLCHELGHILGGEPYQRFGENAEQDWSSAEGQSDWFAATQCLPKVFRHFKDTNFIQNNFNLELAPVCQKTQNPYLCNWIRNVSQKFSDYLYEHYTKRDGITERPSLLVDAKEVAEQTIVGSYPSPQCRLDTLKLGAECAASDETSSITCERPACWYAR